MLRLYDHSIKIGVGKEKLTEGLPYFDLKAEAQKFGPPLPGEPIWPCSPLLPVLIGEGPALPPPLPLPLLPLLPSPARSILDGNGDASPNGFRVSAPDW